MTNPNPAQLSELIASIYDRAIDPPSWGESLTRMRRAFGAEIATLTLVDVRSRRMLLSYIDNVPPEWMAVITSNVGEVIDMWGEDVVLSHPLEEPLLLRNVMPRAAKSRNSYRDEAIARGFIDAMSLGAARDNHVVGGCLFGRVRGTALFHEDDVALARLLIPHLQRTIEFSRMFELANLRAAAFEAALEATAVPTILVSAGAELVHANSAGHAALDNGASLRMVAGRVAGADLASQTGLARAIGIARDRPDAHPRELNVDLHDGAGQLKLLSLPRNTERGLLAPGAAAAIVMTDTAQRNKRDAKAIASELIERHGLTPAEATVAVEIAKGDGRAATAARLGIGEATVRSHLSAIFHKLGINRQAQLVRMIERVGETASSDAP